MKKKQTHYAGRLNRPDVFNVVRLLDIELRF